MHTATINEELTLVTEQCSITVPSDETPFAAREIFVKKTRANYNLSCPRIHYLGEDFENGYLQLIEPMREEPSIITCSLLRRYAFDHEILSKFEDRACVETTLSEMSFIINSCRAQPQKVTPERIPLDKKNVSIFYVRNVFDELHPVRVHWDADSWLVQSFSAGGPGWWLENSRVYYRKQKQ